MANSLVVHKIVDITRGAYPNSRGISLASSSLLQSFSRIVTSVAIIQPISSIRPGATLQFCSLDVSYFFVMLYVY